MAQCQLYWSLSEERVPSLSAGIEQPLFLEAGQPYFFHQKELGNGEEGHIQSQGLATAS